MILYRNQWSDRAIIEAVARVTAGRRGARRESRGDRQRGARLPRRVANEDDSAAETYRGILTVAGVSYSFEVLLFAGLDGAYFVANLSRFAPLDWSAGTRVASRRCSASPRRGGMSSLNGAVPRRWPPPWPATMLVSVCGLLSGPADGGDHAAVRRRLLQRFAKTWAFWNSGTKSAA